MTKQNELQILDAAIVQLFPERAVAVEAGAARAANG